MIKLDISDKHTKLTVSYLVEYITIVDDVISFRQNGLLHKYHLKNYIVRIIDDTIIIKGLEKQ